MTDSETTDVDGAGDPDGRLSVSRRTVLKTLGAGGTLSAVASESVDASVHNRKIVGMKPGRAGIARRKASNVHDVIDLEEIGQLVVGHWPEQALEALEKNPHVKYINEDGIPTLEQEEMSWGFDRIDAEVAHANGDTGSGAHIGILDTGIDLDHPDLVDNLADPNDSSEHKAYGTCNDSAHPDGNCEEDWDDDNGHGTHVAGIAAAVANNDEGVVGVAADATLHAIKIGACSTVCDGIKWGADQGFDVLNASWGCADAADAFEDCVEYALNKGTVFVASAGNEGPCPADDCVTTPGTGDGTITVSSTNDNDGLRGDSSTGPEVDFAAPGNAILSTWNDGGTNTIGGTSMAAPHVTGTIAQLMANGTAATDVKDDLAAVAEDIGLRDEAQGNGLVDLAAALGHDSANDLLEVETRFADDLEYTKARLNGRLTELTGNDSADVFFQYRKSGAGSWTKSSTKTLTSTGFFDIRVQGLEEDTTYEFRACATVEEPSEGWESTEHGEIDDFDTADNPAPTASFTHDPAVPDPGVSVEFDGSSSDPGELSSVSEDDSIVSYEWDFTDDGTFDDTGEIVTHSYSSPGTVTVRLRVTDEFGQTDETTETFRVNAFPVADFDVVTDPPVRDELVEFDASNSNDPDGNIVEYKWDFGDGTTMTTASPVVDHTFTTGGKHTVTLRVTDNDGASDDTISVHEETFTVSIRVAVDIHPNGTGDNSINPKSRGDIPVAVLHTAAFDPPARLDPASVHFGDPDDVGFDTATDPFTPEGGATIAHLGGHVEDVDDDGDMDSMYHFPTRDADFEMDDGTGKLVGLTTDNVPVFGSDDVTIVGGGGGGGGGP